MTSCDPMRSVRTENLSYTEHGLYKISTYFHICSCDLHLTFTSGYSVPSCCHLLWRSLSATHNCNESQDDTTANGRTILCSMLMVVKEQDVFVATHTNSGFHLLPPVPGVPGSTPAVHPFSSTQKASLQSQ